MGSPPGTSHKAGTGLSALFCGAKIVTARPTFSIAWPATSRVNLPGRRSDVNAECEFAFFLIGSALVVQ